MTRNDIILWLDLNKSFNDGLNKICSNPTYVDDLKQELFLILLEKPDKDIRKLYYSNGLVYWSLRVLKNQYHSNSSPFHKKYRRRLDNIDDVEIAQDNTDLIRYNIIESIENILDSDIHWYDSHLFRLYYLNNILDNGDVLEPLSLMKIRNLHTYDDMTLSINTIQKSLNRTLEFIKKKIKEEYGDII